MEKIKSDERGDVYEARGIKIFYRKNGSISGDNSKNPKEKIYLVQGRASVTLRSKTEEIEAPAEFEFPKETHHKIEALTDIVFLVFEG